ncbi:MAG: hypothetical protein II980_06150 [Clostridia bacterium]|nr:hypothetical protein [Clostridia bacterium]
MKKSLRILTTLMLCFVLLSSFSVISFAALPESDVQPLYENILNATLSMGFNGNTGNVAGTVTRKTGTTSMAGIIVVYKYENNDWTKVGEWENTTTRPSLAVVGTFTAEAGAEYKAVFQITALKGTIVEVERLEVTGTND